MRIPAWNKSLTLHLTLIEFQSAQTKLPHANRPCIRTEIGDDVRVSAHRFRHSTASFLCENGADLLAIQKLLGHSKIETTLVYVKRRRTGTPPPASQIH
ncbi:MAG: tyrosine-type recombinase/integrase [Hyphomicrobiales bacterium]|nr:tyrosine-type recombinase/integrase [Hyphomicrobiales bacterium]